MRGGRRRGLERGEEKRSRSGEGRGVGGGVSFGKYWLIMSLSLCRGRGGKGRTAVALFPPGPLSSSLLFWDVGQVRKGVR